MLLQVQYLNWRELKVRVYMKFTESLTARQACCRDSVEEPGTSDTVGTICCSDRWNA